MQSYFQNMDFIDIHYHADPDLYKRRYGVIETGKKYLKLNGAVVLKSHLGSTTIQASIAQQEGLPVFPSIVLNKVLGGMHYKTIIKELVNYHPVFSSRIIVHLPTITGRKHRSNLVRDQISPQWNDILLQAETIFDDNFKLKSELIDIFKLAQDYPIILSTGHASREEVFSLIDACSKFGIDHLLLNQPANPLTGMKVTDLLELAKNPFVWIEQTALTYLLSYQDEYDFRNVLSEVPRVIYSSDLGQPSQMDISDWITTSNRWFSEFNLSTEKIRELCLMNARNLLKI